jgi:2-polyprenyl-3-methyl-5-hydroxy-6-metoxy-1,4-benzoquinol methylase
MIFTSVKRFLGRNSLTGRPYHALARSWHALRFLSNKVRFGRAFPVGYFDRLFAQGADPWRYEDDGVSETRKSLILRLLPAAPVSSILEIGCASGWMTQDLCKRAERVTAIDCSSVALSLAKERCSDCSNIEFAEIDLLTGSLEGRYEVVICAGVLNFFPRAAQAAIRDKIVETVQPGGLLLLEHLRERMVGYEMDGGDLHKLYIGQPAFTLIEEVREDIYEIVVLRRA